MRALPSRPALAFALLGLLAVPASATHVLVVRTTPGPGIYTSIQDAVDAATDGDVVLVRGGNYDGFTIHDKDVSVVESPGAGVQIHGTVRVDGLSATKSVLLSGLDVRGSYTLETFGQGLVLDSNAGSVRVDGCTLRAAAGDQDFCAQREGLVAIASSDVIVSRSWVEGTNAQSTSYGMGGIGLHAVDSRIAVYDTTIVAGYGGTGAVCPMANCGYAYAGSVDGADGGVGVRSEQSELFFARASVHGGGGGSATDWYHLPTYGGCGGAGIDLTGLVPSHRLDTTIAGGLGSPGHWGGGNGTPGPSIAFGASLLVEIAQTGRGLDAPNVARENAVMLVSVHGTSGDEVGLLLSPTTRFEIDLAANGVRATGTERFVRLGTLPGSGTLTTTIVAGELGPGVEARRVFVQSVHRATNGTIVLGTPLAMVLLDAGF